MRELSKAKLLMAPNNIGQHKGSKKSIPSHCPSLIVATLLLAHIKTCGQASRQNMEMSPYFLTLKIPKIPLEILCLKSQYGTPKLYFVEFDIHLNSIVLFIIVQKAKCCHLVLQGLPYYSVTH